MQKMTPARPAHATRDIMMAVQNAWHARPGRSAYPAQILHVWKDTGKMAANATAVLTIPRVPRAARKLVVSPDIG